jgi:hypothetical protein
MAGRGLGKAYGGMNWIHGPTRYALFYRDRDPVTGYPRCLWCGERIYFWHDNPKGRRRGCLDHLKPVSLGGTHHHRNLVSSCAHCNNARRDQDFEAWVDSGNLDLAVYDRIVSRTRRELTDEERDAGRRLWRARKKGPRSWRSRVAHHTEHAPQGLLPLQQQAPMGPEGF